MEIIPGEDENKKSQIISAGQVQNGETYAFTQTLGSAYDYLELPEALQYSLNDIFREYKYVGKLTLYPELQKNGKLHYHGYLKMTDRFKYGKKLYGINQKIGFVCLKSIGDEDKWRTYITKDKDYMSGLLNMSLPITEEIVKQSKRIKEMNKTIEHLFTEQPLLEYNIGLKKDVKKVQKLRRKKASTKDVK